MLAWYLLLLVPLVAVAYAVWAYRRRAAARESASRERLQRLLGAPAAAPPPSPARPAAGAASPYTARERLLDPPRTLIYYLLKSGLSDHEVFARVALGEVIAAGGAPGAGEAPPVLRQCVDFVICDKRLRPVAVVDLDPPASVEALRFRAEALRAAGVAHRRVRADAPPRRDAVRALVLGGAPDSAGGTH